VARRYRGGQKPTSNGGPIRFDNRRKGTHADAGKDWAKGKFPVRDMGRGICNQGGLARAESAPRGLRPFEDAAAGGDTRPTVVAVLYWRGGGNGPVCRRTRGET
jgi:hypothetical protein